MIYPFSALAAEKHLAMVGTLQRYVDIDKTRSLMDASRAGHYPLPYETIQMVNEEQDPAFAKANQEMRAFIAKVRKQQSLTLKSCHLY